MITAKIVDFNEDDKKISLSIKALATVAEPVVEEADADVADVDIDAVAAEVEE